MYSLWLDLVYGTGVKVICQGHIFQKTAIAGHFCSQTHLVFIEVMVFNYQITLVVYIHMIGMSSHRGVYCIRI